MFARRSTHRLFVALACGMILADRSTVVGMAARWRQACWLFSGAVWDIDDLGLAVARLIVTHLAGDGEPVVVACGGTFFRRWGRKVFQAQIRRYPCGIRRRSHQSSGSPYSPWLMHLRPPRSGAVRLSGSQAARAARYLALAVAQSVQF